MKSPAPQIALASFNFALATVLAMASEQFFAYMPVPVPRSFVVALAVGGGVSAALTAIGRMIENRP